MPAPGSREIGPEKAGAQLAQGVRAGDARACSLWPFRARCVAAGCSRPLLIADLPFGSYQASAEAAYNASAAALQAGAHMVKLEGGAWLAPTVEFLTTRAVPVCGHVGLQPQSVNALGGFRVQGKSTDAGRPHYTQPDGRPVRTTDG